jgi:hypothetical protein
VLCVSGTTSRLSRLSARSRMPGPADTLLCKSQLCFDVTPPPARRHAIAREQKLVTAWQSVETQQGFFKVPDSTAYYFRPSRQHLCAVGGTAPGVMCVWDLHREMCIQLVPQARPGPSRWIRY